MAALVALAAAQLLLRCLAALAIAAPAVLILVL